MLRSEIASASSGGSVDINWPWRHGHSVVAQLPNRSDVMFRKDLPVVEELISLLKLISYTGALTFVPYGHGTALAPMGKRLLRSIQQLMMTVVFLLLLVMSVFQLAQLALVLWRMNGVGELMPMIIWVTFFPLALMSQMFYTLKRPVLLRFFRRWEEVHFRFENVTRHLTRAHCLPIPRMYLIYFLTVCVSVAMVIVVLMDFPVLPFLPTTYEEVSKRFADVTICTFFAVGLFYAWNLSAASDLVPSIIYYHLALALEKVTLLLDEQQAASQIIPAVNPPTLKAMRTQVTEETELSAEDMALDIEDVESKPQLLVTDQGGRRKNWQQAWLYYEAVRNLLDETNSQFGLLLLLNHGALFFVASSMIFAILRWFRGMSWLLLLVYGLNAAGTIIRLSSTILLCSRLTATVQKLQSRIIQLVSSSWFTLLRPSERQFFTIFLIRTQDGGTVASPLGLYRITPAMLLTLGSLLVTYLVVLLQSSVHTRFESYVNITGRITGTPFFEVS